MPVKALHHVELAATNLQESERFARDFGLHTVANDGNTLYMRTSGGDAFSFVARQSEEKGTLGIGFLADSESDLEEMISRHGATPIRELDSPGGGLGVTVTHPGGLKVNILTGIESVPASDGPPPLKLNIPENISRYVEPQASRTLGPAYLYRIGHTGIYVEDLAASMAWFQDVLGLKVSDSMHIPHAPDKTVVAFLRIDAGEDWVDHHSVFLIQSEKTDVHHISFQAQDYQAQCVAHRWLEQQGWTPNWGVGKHPLGSHVFDVWFDPDRYRFETYTDTDVVNNTHKMGHHDLQNVDMDLWTSRPPEPYFD